MSTAFSAFLYVAPDCSKLSTEGSECCTEPKLEGSADRVYHRRLTGLSSVARSLLQSWEMRDVTQVTTAALMGKSIEIYVPPCGELIETALGVSSEIASVAAAMFQHLIDRGARPPKLPCTIRIDERLGSPSTCCSHNERARLKFLRNTLKECAGGKPFGFNLFPAAPGVTSGIWYSNHFDIGYLDRRCYQQEVNETVTTTSESGLVSEFLKETYGPKAKTTGKLFILNNGAAKASLEHVSNEETTTPNVQVVRDWFMFEIKQDPGSAALYAPTYCGEHELSRPGGPEVTEQEQRKGLWDAQDTETMGELKASAKSLFKASFKLGKKKIGKFLDG